MITLEFAIQYIIGTCIAMTIICLLCVLAARKPKVKIKPIDWENIKERVD